MAPATWWSNIKEKHREALDWLDAAPYFRNFASLLASLETPTPAIAHMCFRASIILAQRARDFETAAGMAQERSRQVRATPAPLGQLTAKVRISAALERAYHDLTTVARTYQELSQTYRDLSIDLSSRLPGPKTPRPV